MYPETADIETSSADYAKRFSGPAGEWMLKIQEQIVTDWMKSLPNATILDVGGGHGQLAIPFARLGHPVTVLGSDATCGLRLQNEKYITFKTGNVIDLPFPDKSFDAVMCIRLIPHCTRWPELIGQLCRVARQLVIVDYPTIQSINVFSSSMFGLKKKLEGNTRPFTLFKHSEIMNEFQKNNFEKESCRAQFFLPMVLHRKLNSPALSSCLEGLFRMTGLTALFGSPVLLEMKRQ
ncbi:MAG: hypothetical protein A2283_05640 [Lentisphaerae bacterium RIFOXYA12_FULL_48_11]|nr:MAG: hypothetical protein A2283_05640 [Lentisphaerae bacterium RIFOXYA12_FULL_48_11]